MVFPHHITWNGYQTSFPFFSTKLCDFLVLNLILPQSIVLESLSLGKINTFCFGLSSGDFFPLHTTLRSLHKYFRNYPHFLYTLYGTPFGHGQKQIVPSYMKPSTSASLGSPISNSVPGLVMSGIGAEQQSSEYVVFKWCSMVCLGTLSSPFLLCEKMSFALTEMDSIFLCICGNLWVVRVIFLESALIFE